MSSTSSSAKGWMTTKKRGRDDELIDRDRKRALATRRQKKQPPKDQKTKQKGYKLDNFVVEDDDDDEELSECADSSDDDDDDEEKLIRDGILVDDDDDEDDELLEDVKPIVSRRRAKPATNTVKKNQFHSSTDSDEDDDDYDNSSKEGTFFGSYPARSSRPAPALKQNNRQGKLNQREEKKVRPRPPTRASKGKEDSSNKGTRTTRSKVDQDVLELLSSDEDDVLPPSKPVASRYFSTQSTARVSSALASRATKVKPEKKRRLASSDSDGEVVWRARPKEIASSATKVKPEKESRPATSDSDGEVVWRARPKETTKPSVKEMESSSSEDSGDEEWQVEVSRNEKTKSSGNNLAADDDDSDDNIDEWQDGPLKSRFKSKLPAKKSVIELDDEDDDDDEDDWAKPYSKKRALPRNNHDDEDLLVASMPKPKHVPINPKPKLKKKKKLFVREDDDDDEDDVLQVAQRSFQPQMPLDDSSMDEDEAVALAWAIEASQKEQNAEEIENIDQTKMVDYSEEMIQVDAPVRCRDEDAMVASVVLSTADSLSSKVLQTMIRWTQHQICDDSKDITATKIPQGLLVDGALALHTIADASAVPDPLWITKELMQKICPHVQLKDYQLIGVNWFALLHRMKCEVKNKTHTNVNGILADEMGLGKTVQTIAFLAWLKYTSGKGKHYASTCGEQKPNISSIDADGDPLLSDQHVVSLVNSDEEDDVPKCRYEKSSFHPHIIITPGSVLSNWAREFENFCPDMKVVVYNGTTDDRKDIRHLLRHFMSGEMEEEPPDVILTSNSHFSSELADDRNFFRKIKFDYMVIDEGHILKNPSAKRYRNLDMMRTNHRLLLTGTPVQNSPKELMALLCFLMPLFSGRSSSDDYVSNDGGKSMLQHFVKMEKTDGSVKSAYARLKQLFAPFVLRRTKHDVLNQVLPEKERRVEILELDPASLQVYNSVIATHWTKARRGNVEDHASRLSLFSDLRKSANHPLLLRTRHNSPNEVDHLAKSLMMYGYFTGEACTLEKVKEELETFNDLDIHLAALDLIEINHMREAELSRYVLEEDDLFSSAKFVRLRQLLPELISGGHRILIFSQWTRVMDLLGILLENLGLQFLRLDGSVSMGTRQHLIDSFNQDMSINVFLLSTRAGGLGINLTTADTCIIHDLDFNPFNDLQAEDRCHRIGQKNKVTVIKMVTKNTVDESIYQLQQRKAEMNAAIMENPDAAKWFKRSEASDMECILQTALDQFRHSAFGRAFATADPTDPSDSDAAMPSVSDDVIVLDDDSLDEKPKADNGILASAAVPITLTTTDAESAESSDSDVVVLEDGRRKGDAKESAEVVVLENGRKGDAEASAEVVVQEDGKAKEGASSAPPSQISI